MPIPDPPDYDHGSTGTQPPQPRDYINGDPLEANELDYYLNIEFTKIDQIIQALNDIEDGTITVSSATDANNVTATYKGNDIDTDGDGVVDDALNTTGTYKGNDIDSDGDGRVDNADHALNADDADTVDGHNVYVQSTEPSGASSGDIWIDTS